MTKLRVVEYKLKEGIVEGMRNATERLAAHPSSPLILAGTLGLVYFLDGPSSGLNWVADFRYSPDYDQEGCPPELFESLADFLEDTAKRIRAGELNEFLAPMEEQVPTQGSA